MIATRPVRSTMSLVMTAPDSLSHPSETISHMDPERRRLRWKARCVVCGVELPAGSWARWDSERKVASCDACPTAGAADLMVMGRAGASGERQFNRRSAGGGGRHGEYR